MASATAHEGQGRPKRRLFGVRLYLALAFAAVALIAAGLTYVLASGSSDSAAEHSSSEIAVGRTVRLADTLGAAPPGRAATIVERRTDTSYAAWVYNVAGKLVTPRTSEGVMASSVPSGRRALNAALEGGRLVKDLPGGITTVSLPIFRSGELAGAVVA